MDKATFTTNGHAHEIAVGSFVKTSKGEVGMIDSVFLTPIAGYGFVTSDESSWTEKIIPFSEVSICEDKDIYAANMAAIGFFQNEITHLKRVQKGGKYDVNKRLQECMSFLDYLFHSSPIGHKTAKTIAT